MTTLVTETPPSEVPGSVEKSSKFQSEPLTSRLMFPPYSPTAHLIALTGPPKSKLTVALFSRRSCPEPPAAPPPSTSA